MKLFHEWCKNAKHLGVKVVVLYLSIDFTHTWVRTIWSWRTEPLHTGRRLLNEGMILSHDPRLLHTFSAWLGSFFISNFITVNAAFVSIIYYVGTDDRLTWPWALRFTYMCVLLTGNSVLYLPPLKKFVWFLAFLQMLEWSWCRLAWWNRGLIQPITDTWRVGCPSDVRL